MPLSDIERFLALTGISPSKFGRMALGDPRFVFDLRNGRCPRDKTARRVGAIIGAGLLIRTAGVGE